MVLAILIGLSTSTVRMNSSAIKKVNGLLGFPFWIYADFPLLNAGVRA
jgi:hypothetical protein